MRKTKIYRSGFDSSVLFSSNQFIMTSYKLSAMRDKFHNDCVITDYVTYDGEWIHDKKYGIANKSDLASSYHTGVSDDVFFNE